MNGKKWYKSKMLWLNIAAFILAIAAHFGFVIPEVPADWEPFLVPAIALINFLLRLITKQPVTL